VALELPLLKSSFMAASQPVQRETRCAAASLPALPRGEFFSLGGLFAPYVTSRAPFAPWTLSAAILTALSAWDPITSGGAFDSILLGLAAYELLIGLTRAD
jgi:hypothetical protein